jgi:hypothetical protein
MMTMMMMKMMLLTIMMMMMDWMVKSQQSHEPTRNAAVSMIRHKHISVIQAFQ